LLKSSIDEPSQNDAIFVDFFKAFDKVSHSRLLLKRKHYGIRNSTLSWITDFLTGRTQRTLLNEQFSAIANGV